MHMRTSHKVGFAAAVIGALAAMERGHAAAVNTRYPKGRVENNLENAAIVAFSVATLAGLWGVFTSSKPSGPEINA